MEFVAKDTRPALIGGGGFISFVAALDPTYQITSRGHITSVLEQIYTELKAIADELCSVTIAALTINHWKSRVEESYVPVHHSPFCE